MAETWTSYGVLIAIVMVTTGSINTLAAKWADRLEADGKRFDHPFVQAIAMFIGEFLCLVAFVILVITRKVLGKRRDRTSRTETTATSDLGPIVIDSNEIDTADEHSPSMLKFNPLIFLPATLCDMCATSVMYIGLNMTNAASFQMLRGAVIVFTGLLSVAFLRAQLRAYKWLGIGAVVLGLAVVGVSDILFGGHGDEMRDTNKIISGDLLIVGAQIIVATQMVYEQKFVLKYDVHPLLAVGLEGLFGMVLLTLALIPMYYIELPYPFVAENGAKMEDPFEAMKQIKENPLIAVALIGTITSIAFFNFAGISVTKELSATTRMILDSVRTLVIWGTSLLLNWQPFVALQILGFVLLIWGMFVYNDLLFGPLLRNRLFPWLSQRGIDVRCCYGFFGVLDGADEQALSMNDGDQRNGSRNENLFEDAADIIE